ncbi:MAG: NADP-dependent oxidoreductase, partial [Salinisphaera sp.]|nr:NADP-dependent oxidoreductase [Salinisphaera sp.]
MSATVNRRLVLASRPEGIPGPEHFRRDDRPLEQPQAGEFLLRNHYLSIDPAQRGWVNAAANYSDPVPVGGVMRSLAVGQVESSRHPEISQGDYLYGWFGWQDYCIADTAKIIRRVDPAQAPVSAALGVLGIGGVAGYLALTGIGNPQAGETVVVSTAAGSVGSVVGQIARNLGCRTIGITGRDDKVAACVEVFGYDAAVNYRSARDIGAAVRAHCPDGIDVYFDNTSGAIADAMVGQMNVG